MRVVIGITGASGSIYGIRLIEVLKKVGCEIHTIVTESGWQVLEYECGVMKEQLAAKVDVLYDVNKISACIASGSFKTDAMVVVPCSMRTIGSIANGITDNLLIRAADVMIKESRPLILVPREAPLNAIHLGNMFKLAQIGVRIIPASPGFYHRPKTIEQLVDMIVGKICDSIGIETDLFERWQGNQGRYK